MGAVVAGYSHVAICVSDIEQARAFYTDALGLSELPRPGFEFPGAWYQVGALQLHLVGGVEMPEDAKQSKSIGPHFAFHIPTGAFHGTIEQLQTQGVDVFMEPSQRVADGVWYAFCHDPDGNVIELTDMGPVA